ncbi:uncharacterized protein [Procambarus clarkii]|uniref:uncharacterized protein n=1 Tax=Procambarus clarkii TaxID=6728 RepID=UPI00374268A5
MYQKDMLLIGFLLSGFQETQAIMYQQAEVESGALQCLVESVPLPPRLTMSPRTFCALQCSSQLFCNAFCYTESNCSLLELTVASGWAPPLLDSSSWCFTHYVVPAGPSTTDLARYKTVYSLNTILSNYALGQTAVSGARCEVSATDCFCSTYQVIPFWTVDLGKSQAVAAVVVTVSKFSYTSFTDIDVRVGYTGTPIDTLLTTYNATPGPGQIIRLQGSLALTGRIVSLFRQGLFQRSLCLCLVEVYSA